MLTSPEELSQLERQMRRYQRACHHKAVGRLGLHYGQPLMLMIIYDYQPMNQKELACHMNVTPASVTVSVKRMEKSGWITKSYDTQDMRATTICLTPKGEELALACRREMERVDHEMFAGFSDAERTQLADFYRRIRYNLQALEERETK